MMKYLLVLALAAVAFGGCNNIQNGDFEDPNTIDPWLVNSYLGGTDHCREVDANRCELLQQNIVEEGNMLDNAGRISVGQGRSCITNPDVPVGMNVYQANIGMCRGSTLKVEVGVQDNSNSPTTDRTPDIFSIVVGRDNFDLEGGDHTVVATHEFPIPTSVPYDRFRNFHLEGVWTGPAGDSCSPICPSTNCFAVGVRYAKSSTITNRVRGYIDNFMITDTVIPEITVNNVSGKAASCDAETMVPFDVSATDNCCATPQIQYSIDGGNTWFTTPSASFAPGVHIVQVQATDNSGNIAEAYFEVRVYQFEPSINCNNFADETQTCWTNIPENERGLAQRIGECTGATEITYSPDVASRFRLGVTVVTATYTQPDGLDGTYTMTCDSTVQFTLCCLATPDLTPVRSAPATLRKLAKF